MKKRQLIPVALLALLAAFATQVSTAFAQGTAFTYQGVLNANGIPVTGLYDFNFSLFPAESGGVRSAPDYPAAGLGVTNGLFMTTIGFGNVFSGTHYWLEISWRPNLSGEAFQLMGPRVELTPVPYSILRKTRA